ncbi:MAG: NEAT domain-containing protein [Eubacterium sp.]|nr:NEAT domain-containing protein [Eubacterium sp.]
MRNTKRFLPCLLAAAMVVTSITPAAVMAAPDAVSAEAQAEDSGSGEDGDGTVLGADDSSAPEDVSGDASDSDAEGDVVIADSGAETSDDVSADNQEPVNTGDESDVSPDTAQQDVSGSDTDNSGGTQDAALPDASNSSDDSGDSVEIQVETDVSETPAEETVSGGPARVSQESGADENAGETGEGSENSEEGEQEQCPTPELDLSAVKYDEYGFYSSGSIKVLKVDGYSYRYTVDGTMPSPDNGKAPAKSGNITATNIKGGTRDEQDIVTLRVIAYADDKQNSEIAEVSVKLAPADMVTVKDLNLRKAIMDSIGKEGDPALTVLTQGDLEKVTHLVAENAGIKDLTGLEYATNLEELDLSGNDLGGTIGKYPLEEYGRSLLSRGIRSFASLKRVDVSNCKIGAKGMRIDSNGNSLVYFLMPIFQSELLESLDMSGNEMYGEFSVTTSYGVVVSLNNLKTINLSDNDLTAFTMSRSLPAKSLEKIDLSKNRLWPDENAGDWYKYAVKRGLDKYDLSDQKDLLELREVGKDSETSGTVGVDNENRVIELGEVFGDTIHSLLRGYVGERQMSGTIEGVEGTIPISSTLSAQNSWFDLKLDQAGENSFSMTLTHLNGETRTYTVKAKRLDVPAAEENEESAGIKDVQLQKAVISELNKLEAYQGDNALTPSGHQVTKGEMALLTGSLTVQNAANLSGLEYAENLSVLTLRNLKMSGEMLSLTGLSGLKSLTVSGDVAAIEGFDGMTALTNVSISSTGLQRIDGIEKLSGVQSLAVTGAYQEFPDVSSLKELTSLKMTGEYASVSDFSELTKLQTLQLSGHFREVPAALKELPSLQTLSLISDCLSAAPEIPASVTSLGISADENGALPNLSANTLRSLSFYNISGTVKWPAAIGEASTVGTINLVEIASGTYALPGFKNKAGTAITYSITGQEEATCVIDLSDETGNPCVLRVRDGSFTLTGENSGLTQIFAYSLKNLKFDERFVCSGLNSISVDAADQVTFDAAAKAVNLSSLTYQLVVEAGFPAGANVPKLSTVTVRQSMGTNQFPAELNDMKEMQTLTWANSALEDISTLDLSACENLKSLTFTGNGSFGSFDGSKLPGSLTSFTLGSCGIRSLVGSWSHLSNMISLNIFMNPLTIFPSEAIRSMPGLQSATMAWNKYTSIPADTFENSANLKMITFGNWVPVRNVNNKMVPLEGSETEKAIQKLLEVAPDCKYTFDYGPDGIVNTAGNWAGLTEITSDVGSIQEDVFTVENLTMQVPASKESVTLTMQALMDDTEITIGGKQYRSGDSITVPLREATTTVNIHTSNPFGEEFGMDTEMNYSLKITAADYMEEFIPVDGGAYTVGFELRKADGTYSMAHDYFDHNAQVRLQDGTYDIRFTTTAASMISAMRYTNPKGETLQTEVVAEDGDRRTYRMYSDTLEERITVSPRVKPMGDAYVSCYMYFDLAKVVDITDSIGADKADLNAAIVRANEILEKRNIYTSDTWNALENALKGAQEIAALEAAKQSVINRTAASLTEAIEALQIDQAKLADTSELKSAIETAEALTKGNHTDTAWEALQEAIVDAKAVLNEPTSSKSEVTSALKSLNTAVKLFNSSGEASTLDPASLEDGQYSVYVDMMNAANPAQKSMSDGAVTKPVTLTVKNGNYSITANFHGIYITLAGTSFFGYMKELSYWDGSAYTPVTVNSTYDIVDDYNKDTSGKAAYKYPYEMTFPLVNKAAGDDENAFIHVQVFVPIMEAISPGSGTQQALMKIDWSSLKKGSSDAEAAQQKESAVNSLNSTVSDAKNISNTSGIYTDESYQALQTAITEAEALAKNPGATKEQLEAAREKIEKARKGLVKATSGTGTSSGSTGTSGGTKTTGSTKQAKTTAKVVKGKTYKKAKQSYKVTKAATAKTAGTVTFTKAKNAKNITVPKTVKLADGRTYKVTQIGAKAFTASKIRKVTIGANVKKIAANAFARSKAVTVVLKTKSLKKASVKGSLKNSKVKTVQVKAGSAKVNRKLVKKYKKIFTKKIAGKKVTVK